MSLRKGRFSDEETEYIRVHAVMCSVDEIGAELNRAPDSIRKYIETKLHLTPVEARLPKPDALPAMVSRVDNAERVSVSIDLRSSEGWRLMKDEFEDEELTYLEERFVAIVAQFQQSGMIVATEETQILQAVKLEILMHRNLYERKKAKGSIRLIESVQSQLLEEYYPEGKLRGNLQPEEVERLQGIETQLNAARSEEQSRTGEYYKLADQHSKLMQSLKATRDQRLDKIESQKVNFLDIIKMLNQRDIQEHEARQMELMRLAGEKALLDLGRPITYDDGNQDNPILSAQTVDLGPEE